MMKIMWKIYFKFISLTRIIPTMTFSFISGIFLSFAINITASSIHNGGISHLHSHLILPTILMFISSILFMVLVVLIGQKQELYKEMPRDLKKEKAEPKNGKKYRDTFHSIIEEEGPCKPFILAITLLFALLSCIFGIALLL